jgi:hypothetical protein
MLAANGGNFTSMGGVRFNVVNHGDGVVHQYKFDDARSLRLKYQN